MKKVKSIVPLLLVIFLLGCNNSEDNKKEADLAADRIKDETYYMKLPATTLKEIFATPGVDTVKQLKFTWKVNKNKWALEVAGEDAKGKTVTIDYPLEILNQTPVENPHKLKRNPQMITRGELKGFLALTRGTPIPIPGTDFVDIYFRASVEADPRHPGKNLLYLIYSKNLADLGVLAGNGSTNPSPPATPCDTTCDY